MDKPKPKPKKPASRPRGRPPGPDYGLDPSLRRRLRRQRAADRERFETFCHELAAGTLSTAQALRRSGLYWSQAQAIMNRTPDAADLYRFALKMRSDNRHAEQCAVALGLLPASSRKRNKTLERLLLDVQRNKTLQSLLHDVPDLADVP